jgi:hypothetical protein
MLLRETRRTPVHWCMTLVHESAASGPDHPFHNRKQGSGLEQRGGGKGGSRESLYYYSAGLTKAKIYIPSLPKISTNLLDGGDGFVHQKGQPQNTRGDISARRWVCQSKSRLTSFQVPTTRIWFLPRMEHQRTKTKFTQV